MATGFGGAPGLALLTGVAQGITAAEQRRREEERAAIIDRLRQVQIEDARQVIDMRRQEHEAGQIAAQQAAVNEQAAVDELARQIMAQDPTITHAEAARRARAQLNPAYQKARDSESTIRHRDAETVTEERRPALIEAQTEAQRSAAEANRARAANIRSGGSSSSRVPTQTSNRIRAQARTAAEQYVAEATVRTRPLNTTGVRQGSLRPVNESEAEQRLHAIDAAIAQANEDIAAASTDPDVTDEDLLAWEYLITELETIRAEVLRGQRREPAPTGSTLSSFGN